MSGESVQRRGWVAAIALVAACASNDKTIRYEYEGRHVAVGGTSQIKLYDACGASGYEYCERDVVKLHDAWFDDPSIFEITSTFGRTIRFDAVAEGDTSLTILASMNGDREERVFEFRAREPDSIGIEVGCGSPALDPRPAQPVLIAPDMHFHATYSVFGDGLTLIGLDTLLFDLGPIELVDHSTLRPVDQLALRAPAEPVVVELTTPIDPEFSLVIDVYDVARIDGIEVMGYAEVEYAQFPGNFKWDNHPTVGGRSTCNERWPRRITTLTPTICGLFGGTTELETVLTMVLATALGPGRCRYQVEFPGSSAVPVVYEIDLRQTMP